MADTTVSKILALTDTVNGHQFTGTEFGFDNDHTFRFINFIQTSTGTVEIKFGENDDWVNLNILTTPTPADHEKYHIPCKEFWLKPSVANNVQCVVSLYR